ncbi:D-arabinono-1,4-lactone oxidase [Georgenia faecalis]|uniref:D-arabinono-1,4-lactone oxidase n=1 Tax=Georgenia faecalis TaxID=2483799 RepID=UPI000FD8A08D|nr:D-arabinono-1,4-lactone oxidase [Georgenia faecalis]
MTVRNWAGNHSYAGTLVSPASLDEAADVVARSRRVRAIGSRHSFNDIADSEQALVSLDALAYRHPDITQHGSDAPEGISPVVPAGPEPELDPTTGRVRVAGATRYADLVRFLEERGRTLANLASLPHLAVAGALATGTHGSGAGNPILGAAATGLEILTANGSLRTLTRDSDGDAFDGAVVSLGALGLVTAVTLETVPAFDVAQTVYGPARFEDVIDGFEEVSALGYSVSLFTTLRGQVFDTVWLKQAYDPATTVPATILGAPAYPEKVHPIPGVDPGNCTDQLGVPGPAGDRLPHFRADQLPSAGEEIQSEYLIPRARAREALIALDGLAGVIAGLVQTCEVRSIAADGAWLSPMHERDCVAVHFTFVRDAAAVGAVLPLLEATFGALDGVPHWGKVFDADPARLRARYPRRRDFVELMRDFDPDGVFTNDFLRRWVL